MGKVFETVEFGRIVLPVAQRRTADVLFLSGALKAAKNTSPDIRKKILTDIISHTEYSETELSFLFSDIPQEAHDPKIYDFPDSERRRQVIRANRLDAAE